MHQNVTDLSPEQHQAIDLLLSGKTPCNIAEELGIHRQTLWRWRQHPLFQQAYQQLRAERYEDIRDLTSETLRLAISALHREMLDVHRCSWDRFEKAVLVLKLLRNEPLGIREAGKSAASEAV